MADRRFSCKKPCPECPFARATEPDTLGGRDASVYVGQAYGPFWLPCHMAAGYEENKRDPELPQCAGAAMHRDLIGVAPSLPDGLHKLEGDPELVFSTPEEFVAHHRKIPLTEARRYLRENPPRKLLMEELVKIAKGQQY